MRLCRANPVGVSHGVRTKPPTDSCIKKGLCRYYINYVKRIQHCLLITLEDEIEHYLGGKGEVRGYLFGIALEFRDILTEEYLIKASPNGGM